MVENVKNTVKYALKVHKEIYFKCGNEKKDGITAWFPEKKYFEGNITNVYY